MQLFETLKRISYRIGQLSEWGGWAVFIVWVGLMTAGTIMRYIFNAPLLFQVELVSALLVVFCCLCFAPVFLHGSHIRVDLVTRRLSQRVQNWLWVFAELITLAFAVLIITSVLGLLEHSLEINAKFPISKILIVPFQIFIPIGFALFVFVLSVDFCQRLYKLVRKRN